MQPRGVRPREGDFIESVEGIVFDVKGLVHPPGRVVAFPRFIPDPNGPRIWRGVRYRKIYGLGERLNFLKRTHPEYLVQDEVFDELVCEVPLERIKRIYSPIERLRGLRMGGGFDELEARALECAGILRGASGVAWERLGISGSLLIGMHTRGSDIDLVVYGSEACRGVYSALRRLLGEGGGPFQRYGLEDLRRLFDFRSKGTAMSFEEFVEVEARKAIQGRFMDRDYFIRFVKGWDEVGEGYGDVLYRNVGYGEVEATIIDDSEAIFTPCYYRVGDVKVLAGPRLQPIEEIASFRGRFCEHARVGERVAARGKLEHVADLREGTEYFRLLLGSRPSDYMALRP